MLSYAADNTIRILAIVGVGALIVVMVVVVVVSKKRNRFVLDNLDNIVIFFIFFVIKSLQFIVRDDRGTQICV